MKKFTVTLLGSMVILGAIGLSSQRVLAAVSHDRNVYNHHHRRHKHRRHYHRHSHGVPKAASLSNTSW